MDGFRVAPAELEALLIEHPDVADAGVVAVPTTGTARSRWPFVVSARPTDDAALATWLAERVAPYKQPRRVVTVDRLPRTPAGKLLRRELR